MQIIYHPYALLPLLALFLVLVTLARAWRYRSRPVAMAFLVFMLAIAWWSLTAFLEHASIELPAKVFWLKTGLIGIAILPVGFLAFMLQYTNREKWLTRRNMAILAILPVVTLAIVWTNDLHHLWWKDIWLDTSLSFPIVAVTRNIWFWANAIYAYSLLLLALLSLAIAFLHSTGIYRKQAGVMMVAFLLPWGANVLFMAGIGPFSVVDPTPLAFAITGVVYYWSLTRLQLLDIVPIAHKAIFTSMVDAVIVLDTQRRIRELNPAAEHMLGRTSADTIGQPLSRVLPEQAGLAELQPEMTKMEAEIVLGEGKAECYYRAFVSPIHTQGRLNGHLLLLHDDTERRKAEIESRERVRLEAELTERKRAEEEIRKSREYIQSILDNSIDLIFTVRIDGAFNFFNKSLEPVTGYKAEEISGRPFIEYIVEDERPGVIKSWVEEALAGIPGTYETKIIKADGEIADVFYSFSLLKEYNEVLVVMKDITGRRRMEVLAATGQMAARIAHEINNPLAGLKNSFALIKDAVPDNHPDKKFSAYIEKEIERIANIVRQMFVLYRPPKTPASDIDLADTVKDVILMLEADCKPRGITIDFRAPDKSLKTSAPEGSFQQVLYNVIVNAIEASPENGIVRINVSVDKRNLKLVVSDQGNGIPNEIGDRIFEPFFTTKGDTSDGGLGLGLSVSRSLALAMNGSIEYKSNPVKGTEFRIMWPISI